jgi:hypothetical protein
LKIDDGGATNWARSGFEIGSGGGTNNFSSSGSGFTYRDAFSEDLGGGWYRCYLIATITSAITTPRISIWITNGTTESYTGNGSSGCIAYAGMVAQLGVKPHEYIKTTSAQASLTFPALITDGWTVSTKGILKEGDMLAPEYWLYRTVKDVDSDFAGLAVIPIWPNMRVVHADNAPIVVNNPKSIFKLSSNITRFDLSPLLMNGLSFSAVEDLNR